MAISELAKTHEAFRNAAGCRFDYLTRHGRSKENSEGLVLDNDINGCIEAFGELPSSGKALTAGTVIRNTWSRLLINKTQTADVSLFGGQLQLRMKASGGSGVNAGAWIYLEQSGTVTALGVNCACTFTVEGESGLIATYLHGIKIDSSIDSSATVTNFSAIKVETGSSKKNWDYPLDVDANIGVGLMRLQAVSNIIASSGTLTKTEAGYIVVYVGTNKRYVPLYSA